LTQWAANAHWLRDPLPAAECTYGVSFVGAAYGRRREFVDALHARGISVECFGDGWPNGPVSAEDIPRIFRNSRISLNFSDAYKVNTPRQVKARTFEVPGAGGLLLTEYAPGLEQYYELGSQIVSCGNLDEMVTQIRRLEGNPQERDAIASAGNIRTRAEHTYDHRLTEVLEFALAAHGQRADRSSSNAFRNAGEY
jgi:spore maturation protein CgeB